jgi:hypothetical protein
MNMRKYRSRNWLSIALCAVGLLSGCNDVVENWSIVNKRPDKGPLTCFIRKRNFDGMLFGATELELAPGKPIQYSITGYGNVIDLHDVEITAFLDLDGKPFPTGCNEFDCGPDPQDPVVIVKKKGPPWNFNIVFE